MYFEFSTANRILFGPGTRSEIPTLASSMGRHIFLIHDSQKRCEELRERVLACGLVVELLLVENEPNLSDIVMATRIAKESNCELVIGFGGGSVLDTGKATAAFINNPGNPQDYLEVVGSGRKLENPSTPFIAIPTTAGTGSEVTRNAVIAVPERHLKASLRSSHLLPKIAIIDPELTYSLPPSITASTGMDALTQLIEPFVCNSPTPLTDTFCRDGIGRAAKSLRKAYENMLDVNSRQDMALASLFGGLALANARLGAVHGMANPIGGMCHAPHGAVCARLLSLVMETNLRALRQREPNSPAIVRYTEIARLLTGDTSAGAEDGPNWVRDLCMAINIRPLAEYGLDPKDFPALVGQSQMSSSMKGNPIALMDSELLAILADAV